MLAYIELLRRLTIVGLFLYGSWYAIPYQYDEFYRPVVYFFWFLTAVQCLHFALFLPKWMFQMIYRAWVMRPSKRAGSAAWATIKQLKKEKMIDPRSGYLLGAHGKHAVRAELESSGLVVSPAGGGKTVSFVIPALCAEKLSVLVPDLKGTLAVMTHKLRRRKHRQQVITVNPAGLYADILGKTHRYNPLQILMDAWANPSQHHLLVVDAQAIARQLYPDPSQQGENQYFRNGSRKFLVFAFLYLVIEKGKATLSEALSLISDRDKLIEALETVLYHDALSGDFARFAVDLHSKFQGADQRQIESFREGALQALEVFSPSGALADVTSETDFRFSDMKKKRMTIYLMADPTRMKVYGQWLGLMSWCALTELIRFQNGKSVCFLCDEVTNFKIDGLPKMLTLVREFKIKMWLIVQELEEWAVTYGRESLETLLSQTQIKVIMGSRSHKTCQLVSDMLGTSTIKATNYSMSGIMDKNQRSVQEVGRKLMTPEEVRQTEKSIVFVENLPPMQLDQIGYHEIRPWSRWVGINPLFGKRYRGKRRLSVR